MILFHASNGEVEFPEIRKARYTKDFSWGFYCTKDLNQAKIWADRRTILTKTGKPIVNHYKFEPDGNLNILKLDDMTDAWLDFIANCRRGILHRYDIVEGPMADGQQPSPKGSGLRHC